MEIPENGEPFIQVVDNAPDGRGQAVWDMHKSSLPCRSYFVKEPQRGISFARNRAVAEALRREAEFLCFIDDDDLPHSDWLRSLVAVQKEADVPIVFGSYEPPEELPHWMRALKPYQTPSINELNRFGFPVWAATRNVLLRRDLLEIIAAEEGVLFRAAFAFTGSEDTDLFLRAFERKMQYAVAPKSIVTLGLSPDRKTVRGVLRLAFRLGVSGVMLDWEHKSPHQIKRERLKRILSLPKLIVPVLRVPFSPVGMRRGAAVACLYEIFRRLGQISASMGKEFRYYR
jgi:succinoglycan biosynthesis protein ExoM